MPLTVGSWARWELGVVSRIRALALQAERMRLLRLLLAIAILAVAGGCSRLTVGSGTEVEPHIRVSSERVPRHGKLEVHGTGFTPTRNISSHLRRSDGSEFPVLPILTDGRGEFTHTIDTMILELGPHELWVVDDQSGRASNHVQFDVTIEYASPGDRSRSGD